MRYGVYIIQDCGTGTKSMPFFAESDIVAKRQFAATLRSLPPSYRDWETDRKSTRLNSSHITRSRMPSSA